MNFEDLPENWSDQPIHTPERVADVLDLLISIHDRKRGALLLAICDASGRLVQPCLIEDLPRGIPKAEKKRIVEPILGALTEFGDDVGALLAIGREDGLSISPDDQEWAEVARSLCNGKVVLLGVHLITLYGHRELAA